jgi:hypothetical protein
MIELLQPVQRTVNWLWNSHIENTRKILNDSLIIAQRFIEMVDITNPGPAKHIRLSDEGEKLVAAGMDPRMFAAQLTVSDITKGHLETAQGLIEFAQMMAASNDPAQGKPMDGDKTLGEIQSILASSNARLAIVAQIIDATAMRPLCRRSVQNRQQFTSTQQWFRIVGDQAMVGDEALKTQHAMLSKADLWGNYDYIAHSSVLPSDPARSAELWLKLLQIGAGYPMLMDPAMSPDGQVLDVRKIFNKAAQEAGAKNVQEFYRMVQPPAPPMIVPDQVMADQVKRGNAIPAGPPGPPQVPPGVRVQ